MRAQAPRRIEDDGASVSSAQGVQEQHHTAVDDGRPADDLPVPGLRLIEEGNKCGDAQYRYLDVTAEATNYIEIGSTVLTDAQIIGETGAIRATAAKVATTNRSITANMTPKPLGQ